LTIQLNISFGVVDVCTFDDVDNFELLLVKNVDFLDYFDNLESLAFYLGLFAAYHLVQSLDLFHKHLKIAFRLLSSA